MDRQLRGKPARVYRKILRNLGFRMVARDSGSSHEQWKKIEHGRVFAVTLVDRKDTPIGTLEFMIEQSGHTETEWIEAIRKKRRAP